MYFHDICGAKIENIDNTTECPECLCPLTKEHISQIPDGSLVKTISSDEVFMNEMVRLYKNDPIEYQLRIQQFKTQLQQQEQINRQQKSSTDNVPKCPTCQSADIEKISLGKKAIGGAMFGLFSSNVRKTMHCKNCGYKW